MNIPASEAMKRLGIELFALHKPIREGKLSHIKTLDNRIMIGVESIEAIIKTRQGSIDVIRGRKL